MDKVTLYKNDNCKYCDALAAYLDEHGIKYEAINIKSDIPKYKELFMEKVGRIAVPVTQIGSQWFVGFDEARAHIETKLK